MENCSNLRIISSNDKIDSMVKNQKIKKLKLPLNKMTGNEKDYTAVLLEDVNSNMKAFWEVLSGVKEKGDATFEQVGLVTEKIDSIEIRLDSIEGQQAETNKRLVSIEFKLDDLMKEVSSIKEEIKTLKTSISAKADKEKLEILEFKIIRIERHLKLA